MGPIGPIRGPSGSREVRVEQGGNYRGSGEVRVGAGVL